MSFPASAPRTEPPTEGRSPVEGRSSTSSLPPPSRGSALGALVSLANDARDLGKPSLDAPELDSLVAEAKALLERGVTVLSELQRREARDVEHDVDVDDLFSDVPSSSSGPTLGDLCFAGLMELKTSLRELTETTAPDARLAAVESAGRKLRRALRAVLSDAAPTLASDDELVTALSVRRVFAAFRRGLRRADGKSPEAVLRAVQYAAGAIAALVGSPEYASLRASDRSMLRGLRDRAFAWARGARNVSEGLSVLEDIHTSANLLRGINQRQELRVHDWDVLARLPSATGAERLELLVRLEGLDDGLDLLLERLRVGEASDEIWRLVTRHVGNLR